MCRTDPRGSTHRDMDGGDIPPGVAREITMQWVTSPAGGIFQLQQHVKVENTPLKSGLRENRSRFHMRIIGSPYGKRQTWIAFRPDACDVGSLVRPPGDRAGGHLGRALRECVTRSATDSRSDFASASSFKWFQTCTAAATLFADADAWDYSIAKRRCRTICDGASAPSLVPNVSRVHDLSEIVRASDLHSLQKGKKRKKKR